MFNLRAFSATTNFHGYRLPPRQRAAAVPTLWICVRPTSGAAAIGKCQASRRCSGLLQLRSLTIINTWTASRQLQWLYTYGLHAASASSWVGWAAEASHPSLCLRDAVRSTFWDLDMFLWTFPRRHFRWPPLLKVTNKNLLRITI